MSVLVKVLGWTTIILATFLLFNSLRSLFPSNSSCKYNIGCYEVPHSLNHTQEIKIRLDALQQREVQTRSLAYAYRSIVSNETGFNSKALRAARSFQKYVKQFTEEQDFRLQDREIINALAEAEQSYQGCKAEIDKSAISENCYHSWTQYQQCFESINALHERIDDLLKKQKEVQAKIQSEIEQPKREDPENRPQIIAQKIYNDSIGQNERALKELRDKLNSMENKLIQTQEQKDKSQDKVTFKGHAYNQCRQNRKIHKHCEEISQQVKTLSTGTLKQLKEQIEAKKRLLQEMQEMMLRLGKGERKMPEHWTEMYQDHLKELKQMMLDYIQNEHIERKACGCSQLEESQLARELRNEQNNFAEFINAITHLQAELSSLRQLIYQKELEKESIIANYQKALRDYEITMPIVSESHLIKLKKDLEENRVKILQTEHSYKELEDKCEVAKKQLSGNLLDLNKVEQCLSKKDYLLKLKKHTVQYIHPQRSLVKLLQTKRELAEALIGFDQL